MPSPRRHPFGSVPKVELKFDQNILVAHDKLAS